MDFLLILQSPFNIITYSIIGDDRAPNLFSINPSSGIISTSSQSLFSDPNTLYTVGQNKYLPVKWIDLWLKFLCWTCHLLSIEIVCNL